MRLPYQNGACRVSSPYGNRILNGSPDFHRGIDLVGLDGDRTIVAPCDGMIRTSAMIPKESGDKTWEWGNYIRLDTDDGYCIYFCHLAERKVGTGQRVRAGDVIGTQGNTGYSFGEHLHFEMRKNGATVNPAPLLGIQNVVGTYKVSAEKHADKYEKNSLTFRKLKTFRLVYHDSPKVGANYLNYANAGFFGTFGSPTGDYTLPVANLVCDPWCIPKEGRNDVQPFIKDGKLRWSCADNHSPQFKGKAVSTLVVPVSGKPYVADLIAPPEGCLYAISGVPTVRNGDDVDFKKYVKKQGWDDSCMRATWRNWLGVRNGEIWLITGKTTAKNYIYGMQFWNWVKAEGFDDIICLDGGGSFIIKADGKTIRTDDNRRINNLVVFT